MGNEKAILEEKKSKFYFWALICSVILLSFIMGSVFLLLLFKYLSHVNIFNTFLILSYLYIAQLIIELIKSQFVLFLNNEYKFSINNLFNIKFILCNLFMFLFIGGVVLGFSILGVFFNNINIILMFLMIICTGIIYFIYSIEVFNIIDYNIEKCSLSRKSKFILLIINTVFVALSFLVIYLFKYLNTTIFMFITILNFSLCFINKWYLNK